jgi:hypothetical protein
MVLMREWLAAVAALVLFVTPAAAQPTPPKPPQPQPQPQQPPPQPPPQAPTDSDLAKAHADEDRPWATGVSKEEQSVALALFNEGNGLLRDALFPKAVEKYREALSHWDHPAIHYNLALALVNLDQPVEMYEALEKAMAFGAAPLDADKFDRAKGYKLLVEKQLGFIELSISVPGSTVTFDGKQVLEGPGSWSARVRSGEHSVTARAPEYSPVNLDVKVGGGEVSRFDLKLYTDAELTRYSRRFPAWMPWTVAGAGAAIVLVGGILHASARSGFADYDAAIADCALTDPTGGCSTLPSGVADMKSGAESKQTAAGIAYGIGGVALAAGITLIILNQPSSYRIDPTAEQPPPVAITPVVGPGLAGISASGRF